MAALTVECAPGGGELMVAFLEGSHLLCRAEGSLAPFDTGAEAVRAAAAALVGTSGEPAS